MVKRFYQTSVIFFGIIFLPIMSLGAEQGFNYQSYLAANPDLPQAWGKAEAMNHYIHYGFSEKRAACFNIDEYLNANPDLPSNWTAADGLNHYNLYGKNENRSLAFDAQEYLSLYADLPQTWSYDQAYNHYINYGSKEGRIASFDETAYLEMYPDLPGSWGQTEAFSHYILYGKNEGRVYDPYDESVFNTAGNTPNVVYEQSMSATANGTYTYSNNNTLTYLFTQSNFPPGGGPTVNITRSTPIIQLTDTTLIFKNEDDEIMTWHREQGQAGDISGTWTMYEEDQDKYLFFLNSDETMALTVYGAIFDVPNGTITIDGNFNDWSTQHLAFVDTDSPDCSDYPGLDLKEVYIAADESFIYLRFVLNGPPDATYGYKFGNDHHILVSWDEANTRYRISLYRGTDLPQIDLPNNFVYVQGNQFECKFYKSDIGTYWPIDDALGAWLDQGSETDCRDYEDLPFLRFN